MKRVNRKSIEKILSRYQNRKKSSLLSILQEIQTEYNYLPRRALELISELLDVPKSKIWGLATFYAQFSLTPRGKNVVRVCRGTSCHVRGGKSILRVAQQQLGITEGETREDLQFTLETVACLGTCFLSPVMMVNRNYYGKLVPSQIQSILGEYE